MAWYEKWAIMVIAAAIGVAAYHGVPWGKMDVTIWAYWVAAIGTTGTLIGTIWLASSEARTRQRERMALAVIQAAHCQHKLQAMLQGLERIVKLLGPSTEAIIPINNRLVAIETIDSFKRIENQELAILVPLGGNCAMKIARIQNTLGNLRAHILEIGTHQPRSTDGRQLVSLDTDSAYFAAVIAQRQVERGWEVMNTFKNSIND